MKKICGIDWSNGIDNTCFAFADNSSGVARFSKVVYFTPEETELLRLALNTAELAATGSTGGEHSTANNASLAIALMNRLSNMADNNSAHILAYELSIAVNEWRSAKASVV
jgi:hypothetical protein